ncbi:hypothetical protein [Parabacteroides sp. PF5-9]|uniref:hypothetical protein n=1 Tax=Parabacteroides sp. PF5-9 TaxID=1742404 RepID=UPI00247620A0|nr:hypothetical protein [Parabacteroides sp. PF5-9]MDH6356269.1 hypothetical protein [Parabacteroides sp. PF5-9]
METQELVFKSTVHLSSDELLEAVGLSKETVKEIITTDYYNYSLDEGKVYECTHYEVKL